MIRGIMSKEMCEGGSPWAGPGFAKAGQIRVTVISPGYTATDFPSHVRDADLRARLERSRDELAMPLEAVAQAMAYAIEQPEGVNVGEIVVRPAAQP